jgi:hypothetical protein
LGCLHNIILAVADSGKQEHFDPVLARRLGVNTRQMLFSRVADLIRMAFSASAALVTDVRLAGLVVLRDVVEVSLASRDVSGPGLTNSDSLWLQIPILKVVCYLSNIKLRSLRP